MKKDHITITIVKNTLAVFLTMQIILSHAMGAARDENLPPGKNMNKVEWIQIPLADPFHLIVCSKSVQKELRITQKQLGRFRDMEPLFRSELRELSYDENQKNFNEIQQHLDAARNGIMKILDQSQLERLRQLLLQLHGPCSIVNDPKLSVLLKITDKQSKEINTLLDELEAKSNQIYTPQHKENEQSAGLPLPGVAANQKHMQQLLQSLNSKVYKLFSAKQKRIYKEAKGRPFSFKLEEDPVCLDDNQ